MRPCKSCNTSMCSITSPCLERAERQRLFSARWRMAYNAARVRAQEKRDTEQRPLIHMEIKR